MKLNHTVTNTHKIIPEGSYVAQITYSKEQQTRDCSSTYLSLCFEVLQGEQRGVAIWDNLSLKSLNADAMRIAHENLNRIALAIGFEDGTKLKESEQLHKKPMVIKVKIAPEQGGYPEKNEIKGYAPFNPLTESPEIPF